MPGGWGRRDRVLAAVLAASLVVSGALAWQLAATQRALEDARGVPGPPPSGGGFPPPPPDGSLAAAVEAHAGRALLNASRSLLYQVPGQPTVYPSDLPGNLAAARESVAVAAGLLAARNLTDPAVVPALKATVGLLSDLRDLAAGGWWGVGDVFPRLNGVGLLVQDLGRGLVRVPSDPAHATPAADAGNLRNQAAGFDRVARSAIGRATLAEATLAGARLEAGPHGPRAVVTFAHALPPGYAGTLDVAACWVPAPGNLSVPTCYRSPTVLPDASAPYPAGLDRVNATTLNLELPRDAGNNTASRVVVLVRVQVGLTAASDRCTLLAGAGWVCTTPDAPRRCLTIGPRSWCYADAPDPRLTFEPDAAALRNGTLRGNVTLTNLGTYVALAPPVPAVTLNASLQRTTPQGPQTVPWYGSSFGSPSSWNGSDVRTLAPGGTWTVPVTFPGGWTVRPNATYLVHLVYRVPTGPDLPTLYAGPPVEVTITVRT